MYYITLNSGESIDDAVKKMLHSDNVNKNVRGNLDSQSLDNIFFDDKDINKNNCFLLTFQGCLSQIHAPDNKARISGKIISN